MSVQVAVRIRPFSEREVDSREDLCVETNQATIRVASRTKGPRTFSFDRIFWSMAEPNPDARPPQASQADVYREISGDVLDNVLQGFNHCMFAYGQTGSGKSYSMMGSDEAPGIIPRLIEDLFGRIEAESSEEKTFEVRYSMLEIYNEKVHDLLVGLKGRREEGLKIKMGKGKNFYVQGLRWEEVNTLSSVMSLLERGNRNRSVAATQMNAHSSRAHTLVTLRVKVKENVYGNILSRESEIHLVDLAGSEKVGKTGVKGRHLREGCHINKSLTSLGRVITILAEKSQDKGSNDVVPYRESALTKILKNALGGNSKTYMLCTLSPALSNFEETLSTLHYANQAKRIRCHAVINESKEDRKIRLLKEENEKLRRELEKVKGEMHKIQSRDVSFDLGSTATPGSSGKKETRLDHLREQFKQSTFKLQSIVKHNKLPGKLFKSDVHFRTNLRSRKKQRPLLINVNEDPMLTGKLVYDLEQLREVRISQSTTLENWTEDLIMSDAPGIREDHGKVVWRDQRAEVHILPAQSKAEREAVVVNEKKLFGGRTELAHGDVLIIGKKLVFVYSAKGIETKPKELPEYETVLRTIRTRTRTIIEEIETVESADFETLGEETPTKKKVARLRTSLSRCTQLLGEKNRTIEDLQKQLRVYDEDESKRVIETGNGLSRGEGLRQTPSLIGTGLEKKIKRMNDFAMRNGRSLRLTKVEYPFDSGIFVVRVDNFELGYAYVWDVEQLSERSSRCLRQKKTLSRAQLKKQQNTTKDPLWSRMHYVFLGEARLSLVRGQDFTGNVSLEFPEKQGFLASVRVRAEASHATICTGGLAKGWTPVVKYYLKLEWQRRGQTELKRLRSGIFDFPKPEAEASARNDFFEHHFADIFEEKPVTEQASDQAEPSTHVVLKAYGVIAAQRLFGKKDLSESVVGFRTSENDSRVRSVAKVSVADTEDYDFLVKNSLTNFKPGDQSLKDDKPCCAIF